MFHELVLRPLTYEVIGDERSYQYDMPPYQSSWGGLQVSNPRRADSGLLVRVTSVEAPMDSLTYISDDEERTVPLADAIVQLVLK